MRILIVNGMIGSGKTTFILALLERICQDPLKKIAIIVNDFGSICISEEVINRHRLEIIHIVGGCICCSMRGHLLSYLDNLQCRMKPDIVIIEAAGISKSCNILGTLEWVRDIVEGVSVIEILDSERLEDFIRDLPELIESRIDTTDFLLLNRIDRISDGAQKELRYHLISRFGYEKTIINTSSLNGDGVNQAIHTIIEALLQDSYSHDVQEL